MIGQINSDAVFTIENESVAPQDGSPRDEMSGGRAAPAPFRERMSLVEARATLLAAMRALGVGGFTRRAGIVARDACGARFGKYKPVEILNWLKSDDFGARFEENLGNWKETWGPPVSSMAAQLRESQYRACLHSIKEKWWERIADALESMLAARAQQIVLEDSQGNRRVQSLIDVLDLMFSIPMTAARAARMKVVGMSE